MRHDRHALVERAFGRLLDEADAERAGTGLSLQPARHAEIAAHVEGSNIDPYRVRIRLNDGVSTPE